MESIADRSLLRLTLVSAALIASTGGTAFAQPLRVEITAPTAGHHVTPTVSIEARVSDPSISRAVMMVNGTAIHVPVTGGRIEQALVAIPGNNRIAVIVESRGRVARDSLTFRYDGPRVELLVLLTWPSESEIIDLWVREPSGETCKWDHRHTAAGGELLDFSSSAIGLGSQAYRLSRVRAGAFRLKIHYWQAGGTDDDRQSYAHEALITRLDDLDTRLAALPISGDRARLDGERTSVLRQLDRWALPGAPQTRVHAEVILFPGSAHERRWSFDRLVERTGQLVTLGDVVIDDAMIRTARQETR